MNSTPSRRFRWWHETVLAILFVVLMVSAAAVMPNFVSWKSQLILSKHLWEIAILSLGMTLIIITGGIDLSVGSAMGMCAVAFGITFAVTENLFASGVVCLAVGFVGGAINGLLISKLRLHPLIVTLATYAAFRGIAEGVSQGRSYSQFGAAYSQLARGTVFGVPFPGFIFISLAILFAMVLGLSPSGRFIYAMGHNEKATKFSGVAVDRIKFFLYTMSGVLAGLATLVYISRFDTAKADAGIGYELDVITAVVIGGTSIFGGRGNVAGTVLGLMLIHETKLFVGRYWRIDELKSVLVGLLLIMSVLVHRLFSPKADDLS